MESKWIIILALFSFSCENNPKLDDAKSPVVVIGQGSFMGDDITTLRDSNGVIYKEYNKFEAAEVGDTIF